PSTVLVLTNAVWFYGSWQHPFSRRDTRDESFFLVDGTAVTVPFMFRHAEFLYRRGEDCQVIELPYDQSDLAFTVILPDDGQFEAVEARLDSDMLNVAINRL